jgi:hypothetical protein
VSSRLMTVLETAALPLSYTGIVIGRGYGGRTHLSLVMSKGPSPAEAPRHREHDSNVRALARDLSFKGSSVGPLPRPGIVVRATGVEPAKLRRERPPPLPPGEARDIGAGCGTRTRVVSLEG